MAPTLATLSTRTQLALVCYISVVSCLNKIKTFIVKFDPIRLLKDILLWLLTWRHMDMFGLSSKRPAWFLLALLFFTFLMVTIISKCFFKLRSVIVKNDLHWEMSKLSNEACNLIILIFRIWETWVTDMRIYVRHWYTISTYNIKAGVLL